MTRHLLTVAVLATATFAPLAASAQPMNLVDAVSYALDHTPVVAQKVAALAQAQHSLAQARATAFPTVNGSLQNVASKSGNYQGAYGVIGAQQQSIFSQNTAQIGTNYTLTSGGLSLLQLTSARASEAQAREDLANTEDQIATSVTSAYYSVMQKQAIVVVDESDLKYQDVLVDVAKAKEHAGVAAGVDVLKAQVNQVKSASTLLGAQADVDNARESLALAVGAPLDQAFVFPEKIAQPPLPTQNGDQLQAIALANRPDAKASQESLVAAQTTRRGWDRELFPTVALSAGFGNQFSPTLAGQVVGVNPNGTPIVTPRGTPGFWTVSAQTAFTLPFVDYNQRHSERTADDAQVAAAQLLLDQTLTQVEVDVRQSYRSASTALAQVDYAQRESALGTESARIAQLQYQHGLIALADVIQTQQQSVVAQSDFVNARVAYVNAIVKLRVSLGIYTAPGAVADLK